jgi:hypothetical protein
MNKERHILGISGGKDSAALAVYMSQKFPDLDLEYFFTDTGEELPEVYDYLTKLEGYLGKQITRLNPSRNFQHHLKIYGYWLPSAQQRWCTDKLKIKPLEKWIKPDLDKGTKITSYVAIRYDEKFREGHQSTHENYTVKLPFMDDKIDRKGVYDLLDNTGLGVPEYYQWRSRSGCTFCFFQRKIEWVRLKEKHPDAFEFAKHLEGLSSANGVKFTWSERESLLELEKPERVEKIKEEHEKRRQRELAKRKVNPLDPDEFLDDDELFGQGKYCLTCHK